MYAYIIIIVTVLALTSCTISWETNTKPMIAYQPVPEEEKAPYPVPGQPYEVPPLPVGGGMSNPNPLLPVHEYSLTSAPKAIPVAY